MYEHLHFTERLDGERLHYIISAQDAAAAWAQQSSAAQTKWSTNLQNTQKDIVGRAVAQQPVLIANFADSVNSGRWAQALQRVGNAGIKSAAQAKAQNYSTGVSASVPKMQAVFSKLLPYIASGEQMIDSMPSGTISASKARASAWIDYMHAGKGQFGA